MKKKKIICEECKEREATALINCKNVCERCFNKLKIGKRPFNKTSWLNNLVRKNGN